MQILLNENNLQAAVILFVQERLSLSDDESLSVELTNEGATVTILGPGEEVAETIGTSNGVDKPAASRRTRRTKAQIEADAKAEEEAKQAAQADAASGNAESTPTSSAEAVTSSEPASNAAASSSTDEPSVDPQQSAEPAVAVEAEPEPEPTVETKAVTVPETEQPQEAVETVEETPKPTTSLFANLRKPKNQ